MSLDDALVAAGQVLADYSAAAGQGELCGGWPGRLAQALRDLAAAAVARPAAPAPGLPPSAVPGQVVLSRAEAGLAGLAAADAVAWHAWFGDCAGCVAAGACSDRVRHGVIVSGYGALRRRLLAAGCGRWP